jgi:hypothetical protein
MTSDAEEMMRKIRRKSLIDPSVATGLLEELVSLRLPSGWQEQL